MVHLVETPIVERPPGFADAEGVRESVGVRIVEQARIRCALPYDPLAVCPAVANATDFALAAVVAVDEAEIAQFLLLLLGAAALTFAVPALVVGYPLAET